MIKVDIEIGSKVVARLPARYDESNQQVWVDFHVAEVTNVRGDIVDFIADNNEYYSVPKWRILEFTFGGIKVRNPKCDLDRCDREDNQFVEYIKRNGVCP